MQAAYGIGDLIVDQNPVFNIGPGMIISMNPHNNEIIYFIRFPRSKESIPFQWNEDFIKTEINKGGYKHIPRKHARA